MSSTFIIEGETAWMPQSWIFRALLRRLIVQSDAEDGKLSLLLNKPLEVAEAGFAFMDISGLDTHDFNVLRQAIARVFDKTLMSGPGGFREGWAYSEFLTGLSLLKAILLTDQRATEEAVLSRTLQLRKAVVWNAPRAIYDLVLENIALAVFPTDKLLCEALLECRNIGCADETVCDLTDLEADRFELIFPTTKWLLARYGDGSPRDAYAPKLYSVLAPAVVRFAELVFSDERVTAKLK